jgi:hypothetical protein
MSDIAPYACAASRLALAHAQSTAALLIRLNYKQSITFKALACQHLEQVGQVCAKTLKHSSSQRLRVRLNPLLQCSFLPRDDCWAARVCSHPARRGYSGSEGECARQWQQSAILGQLPACHLPHHSSAKGFDSSMVDPFNPASFATCV